MKCQLTEDDRFLFPQAKVVLALFAHDFQPKFAGKWKVCKRERTGDRIND